MSAEQICEVKSQEVGTFRETEADDWSDEDSSGESTGAMKAYSYSDITEELIKNGDTLRRNAKELQGNAQDPIYENIRAPGNSNFYIEEDCGWSSSEFDDSDEPDSAQPESSGPKSLDFFKGRIKKLPPKPFSMNSKSQERVGVSKSKQFFEGIKRNARQSSMLDKISRFGQRKARTEEMSRETDNDLEPLNFKVGSKDFQAAHLPATLPESITPVQMKRRQIMNAIVESEKSYLFALKRLIEEYQLPLMTTQPPIIEQKHVKVIFHKVRDIVQCHLLFHGELHDVAERWDAEEKIGDVFIASFSKSMVFEAYSSFVNNFQTAMDRAKKQARMKSAFSAFLKEKLDTSSDKLSLFGLMVKPVQRFPQFIMLIQDLLKNTPKDHPDRLSLQLALTELEMLTDRLNETKKECESFMEAKRLSKVLHLGGLSKQEGKCLFIRQDDVMQHKVRDGETESKLKRIFMLSDQLVCASVNKQKEFADPGESLTTSGEKFVVTWSASIKDIEVVEATLPSLKSHPLSRQSSGSQTFAGRKSGKPSTSPAPSTPSAASPYRKDMDNMLHDLKIFEEMKELHAKLKLKYEALPQEVLKGAISSLELLIRQKIDIDKNILTVSIPNRLVSNMMGGMTSSLTEQIKGRGRKLVSLEFPSLTMKHAWLIDLQSAKLATDPNNFPAWFLSENDPLSSRNPRFMTSLKMDGISKEDKRMTLMKAKKKIKDELSCCTYVTLPCHNKPGSGIRHLWVCSGGRAAIVSLHTNQAFVVNCFDVADGNIAVAECVPEPKSSRRDQDRAPVGEGGEKEEEEEEEEDFRELVRDSEMKEIVWMVSDDNKIFRIPAIQAENHFGSKPIKVDGAQVRCMKYLDDRVYLGTLDGTVIIYSRLDKGEWNFASPQKLSLGKNAVSFLMVANDDNLWASCDSTVHVLGLRTHPAEGCGPRQVYLKDSHILTNDVPSSGGTPGKKAPPATIECMVNAGVGLLVSFTNQSTIRLFHSETFQHLQDINISSAINQLLEEKASNLKPDLQSSSLSITCMLPNKGILYVGTNQGFVLTLPLPRLNGMPQFRQRPAISYQGHSGPVKFLASINCSLVDGNMDGPAPKEVPKQDKSCRVSSDTLIGEEHSSTLVPEEEAEQAGMKQNGDRISPAPPQPNPSLSTSTPDLTSLQDDLASVKCQQVNGLYESLLRGVMENSDDTAVLQRIASTPLPHRRHRIHNILRSVLETMPDGSAVSQGGREDAEQETRSRSSKKRNAKLRHSMTDILESSADPETIPPQPTTKGVSTFRCAEEGEQEISVQRPPLSVQESTDDKEPIEICTDKSTTPGTFLTAETSTDKEIPDEATVTASHLNKSASSASDTPSQKSSSSASSAAKQKAEPSPITDSKFGPFSRFSIPSNTAMISSTLTTTPKSRAIVFVSAGKGHVSWNSTTKENVSQDKPCLLLWMC